MPIFRVLTALGVMTPMAIPPVLVNGVLVVKDGHSPVRNLGEACDRSVAFARKDPWFSLFPCWGFGSILNMRQPRGPAALPRTLALLCDRFTKLAANGGNFARIWLSSDFWDVEHERPRQL
jgi:hypothetical protein